MANSRLKIPALLLGASLALTLSGCGWLDGKGSETIYVKRDDSVNNWRVNEPTLAAKDRTQEQGNVYRGALKLGEALTKGETPKKRAKGEGYELKLLHTTDHELYYSNEAEATTIPLVRVTLKKKEIKVYLYQSGESTAVYRAATEPLLRFVEALRGGSPDLPTFANRDGKLQVAAGKKKEFYKPPAEAEPFVYLTSSDLGSMSQIYLDVPAPDGIVILTYGPKSALPQVLEAVEVE